ncbi:MAG TPA: glycine--tRNA ligase subunit beta [Synergistaceae bacterium]|nr:glycine--tRNA ligase subunit beta [Synergistaceae bacterium]HPJ26453.1 glycine--tRNA ligase subunit beta [Synergistaceae bacterium]HPQ37321.1 glycine--tRNA ligase subunit beta [Synergistaceae bacterium]
MEHKDLLLEIGTEEIPAGFLLWVREEILAIARKEMETFRIPFSGMESYATPRRITILLKGVAEQQEDAVQESKGPAWQSAFDANGNPTKAAHGFARSRGLDVSDLEMREVGGTQYAFAVSRTKGLPSREMLPEVMLRIIKGIVFPKNMYWNESMARFARPIRWLLCLWGDEVVPFEYAGLKAGRITRGHRFMGKKEITVSHTESYLDLLYDNYVIADPEKRREKMLGGIAALEKEIEGHTDIHRDLADEILYLVEYPVPFYGSFDETYLEMPEEVLTTTMASHQRYFPVRDDNKKLKALFVGVSNNRATNMGVVREGNERVLRARLADASFFWREDQKKPLAGRVKNLGTMVYQEQLGTLYEKCERSRDLAAHLASMLGLDEETTAHVDRTAFLAKADLLTHMVYEFAELRGIMGREYAKRNGEPPRVALGIYEQYLPENAGGTLPSDMVGAVVGFADRMDTVVACYKVGLEPTGSQDPYALRRAARCMNELIWGMPMDVDIENLVRHAAERLEADPKTVESVLAFLRQRLLMQLKERDFSHEMVTMAMEVIWMRPLRLREFLETLREIVSEEWFQKLATAVGRVNNILQKAENAEPSWREDLFESPEEKNLGDALSAHRQEIEEAMKDFQWKKVAEILAELESPITAFFDNVMVMAEDETIRNNRLGLLEDCRRLFAKVGNLASLKQ